MSWSKGLPSHEDFSASSSRNSGQKYKDWNEDLADAVSQFANEHPKEITAMIYSAYDTFIRVLRDPISHGFSYDDAKKEGGGIWFDHLHPTSAMHNIIASDMVQFLGGQPAFSAK